MSAPIQLNMEQFEGLQALKRERDIRLLCDVLSTHFPAVPPRLGDRFVPLVEHGVSRAQIHDLTHVLCVARYLACWFMLGAEFEVKPGFAWAQELLQTVGKPQGAKVFQLCRRTREELKKLASQPVPPPGVLGAAAFDAAIGGLDATLAQAGTVGSLLPPGELRLGEACDIDALDLRLIEASPQLHYLLEAGQWRRMPLQIERRPITLSAGAAPVLPKPALARAKPPALPERLNLLANAGGRDTTRLRVRTRAAMCCEPSVHPLVAHNSILGLNEWRGPAASDISLSLLPGAPAEPIGDSPRPVIAVESSPRRSALELSSCGLRDEGTSLGSTNTEIAVYLAEQHLMAWRREPGAPMIWPEPASSPAQAPAVRCRIERDGLPLDVSRWQAGLEDLDRQLAEGLGRLANAWERESGVSSSRVQAEPSVLSGSAAMTWGWAESPEGLQASPHYRVAGLLDLVACRLNLRLSGELALQGSLSQLILHCAASQSLQFAFERGPKDLDLLATLAPAQVKFTHPFVIELQAVARDELAVMSLASPVAGALVGACGLRPCADKPGLQWFAQLDVAPLSVVLNLVDPVLGEQSLLRPLLPAIKILNWSLG